MGQAEPQELWETEGEMAPGLVGQDAEVGAVAGAEVPELGTLDQRGREGHW